MKELQSCFAKNPSIREAIVFGSRAKGTARPGSDIDIALKGDQLKLEDVLKLSVAIDDFWIPNKVDLVIYDRITELELKDHIDRAGISIYHSSG